MRLVKKACVSSSAIPSRWSTQPSRVTLMLKVKIPMAASLLRVGLTAGLSLVGILPIDHGIGEARHDRATMRGPDRCASFGKLSDEGDRTLDFCRERLAKTRHPGLIKERRFPELYICLWMK